MQLQYNNQTISLARKASSLAIIFEKVNELIEKEDRAFSHLIIDNKPVYEQHEDYILKRINDIVEIRIVTYPVREMIVNTMNSIYDYLEGAIPALQTLADESYQGFKEETWLDIQQLTEGMQSILQFVEATRGTEEKPYAWEAIDTSFKECETQFGQLLKGIEEGDTVFITDVLAYGILPAYEMLKANFNVSLKKENITKGLQ